MRRTRPRHRTLAAALAAAVATTSAPLLAAPTRARPRVAVLPTAVTGELEQHWQNKLADRLLAGLVRGEFEVADVAGPEAAACGDMTCRRTLAASANAQYLVAAGITAGDRQYRVAVELVDGSTGGVIALAARDCDVCTVEEVGELLADATGELRGKLDLLVAGPPVVAIETTPGGALVELDGTAIGNAPIEREVTAGAHEARVSKPGFVPQQLTLRALPGHRELLALQLQPVPRSSGALDRRRDLRPWGWTALAVGVAALAAGAALLAVDGRPDRSSCRGDGVDADGDCRYLYDSVPGGATLTVLGSGAAISGIVMLAVHAHRKATRRRARGRAAVARGD